MRKFCFLLSILLLQTANAKDLSQHSRSVFKLFVTHQAWNSTQPWTKSPLSKSSCTGFLVAQGIITNAHCITDATYIQMEIPGHNNKVEVRLKAVNHQVDLALLEAKDPKETAGLPVINFGLLPQFRDKVVTIGYPTGGNQVSYTEGVVSRIDIMGYVHSGISSLMVQTDAAINPGNSGGPVFSDFSGECLGVATQKNSGGEGLGYFVPSPMVQQFLTDLEDQQVDGIPALGIYLQPLENPALRRFYQMGDQDSGVRIKNIVRDSGAEQVLQVNDVLLSMDGTNIMNDGRVPFRETGKIGLSYLVTTRQIGETIAATVLRQGERIQVNIPLTPYRMSVIPTMPAYDIPPRYHVLGGLVFQPVDPRYMWRWGRYWPSKIPASFKQYMSTPYGQDDLSDLVVISAVLNDSINKGYSGRVENVRISKVGKRDIHNFDELVSAIQAADGPVMEIVLENDVHVILDRTDLKNEDAAIRARYNIPVPQTIAE